MKKIIILSLSLIIIHFFLGCGKKDYSREEFYSSSKVVGVEGGAISTASGAVIIIPPGSLKSSEEITITSFETQLDLPENCEIMGRFAGGLHLSPDGLSFQKPVTITIPLNIMLDNMDEVILFYYDKGSPSNSNYPADYSGWQQTDYFGTVSYDRQSVTSKVDHFSTYVIQLNFGENTLDVLGEMVGTLGENNLKVDFKNYQTYFESKVANLGDLHIYDLTGGFGYDCYTVVGLEYNLYHDLGLSHENPLYDFKGKEGEVAFFYCYEGDNTLQGQKQLIYNLFINVYIDRIHPKLDLKSQESVLQIGDQTNILSCLTCGIEPMKNQNIYFDVNYLGLINATEQTTDENGVTEIILKAGNEKGVAIVVGKYDAHNKDKVETISNQVSVVIQKEATEENVPCYGCHPFVIDCPPSNDPFPMDPPPIYFNGILLSRDYYLNHPDYSECRIEFVTCKEYCENRPDDSICD